MRDALFDKLDSISILYTNDQKLFWKLELFNLKANCLHEDKNRHTETTNQMGRHVPFSGLVSSNMTDEPFFCAVPN